MRLFLEKSDFLYIILNDLVFKQDAKFWKHLIEFILFFLRNLEDEWFCLLLVFNSDFIAKLLWFFRKLFHIRIESLKLLV